MSDPRSTDELIAATLIGDENDQAAWAAVRALHIRGDATVFLAATQLLKSRAEKERARGADILAQLEEPLLRVRCADEVLAALEHERAPRVLESICHALGHLKDKRAVAALIRFKAHDDDGVRRAVVSSLSSRTESASIDALIELSRDLDDNVRNWATFALATMEEVDTPALRDALIARLSETDREIQGEALRGLAWRRDARVLEPLLHALSAPIVDELAIEAAGDLAEPSLVPLLRALEKESDPLTADVLAAAIVKCSIT